MSDAISSTIEKLSDSLSDKTSTISILKSVNEELTLTTLFIASFKTFKDASISVFVESSG